jgi:hypothetical protein
VKFIYAWLIISMAGCHHGAHGSHGSSRDDAAAATSVPLTEANLAVPIAPGRTQAWQEALHELVGARYAEYRSSRQRFGLTSQTTFLQTTPTGDFAVIHLTGADVRASFHAMSTSQDPWDVKWRDLTQSLHGMDFAKGEKVTPKVEPLFTTDERLGLAAEGRGEPFMFLVPLAPGAVPQVRALAAELMGSRHAAYVQARLAVGLPASTSAWRPRPGATRWCSIG